MDRVRQLITRVARNWPLKLAALTLSLLVWVLVSAEETTTQLVGVQIAIDVPPTLALASPIPQVRALVSGTGRDLIKLYATPLAIQAAMPATTGNRWHLPIGPANVAVDPTASISILDVQPREIVLDVDRLVRKTVPVALRGAIEVRNGWVLDSLQVVPATVEVSGARSRMAALDSARTEAVDLSDVDGAFQRTVAVDTTGYPLLRFAPRQVVVKGRATRP